MDNLLKSIRIYPTERENRFEQTQSLGIPRLFVLDKVQYFKMAEPNITSREIYKCYHFKYGKYVKTRSNRMPEFMDVIINDDFDKMDEMLSTELSDYCNLIKDTTNEKTTSQYKLYQFGHKYNMGISLDYTPNKVINLHVNKERLKDIHFVSKLGDQEDEISLNDLYLISKMNGKEKNPFYSDYTTINNYSNLDIIEMATMNRFSGTIAIRIRFKE